MLALLVGLAMWAGSKSAIHEIAALVSFLIGWVLIVGGAILGAMLNIGRQICERLPQPRAKIAPAPAPDVEPAIPAPRQVNPKSS